MPSRTPAEFSTKELGRPSSLQQPKQFAGIEGEMRRMPDHGQKPDRGIDRLCDRLVLTGGATIAPIASKVGLPRWFPDGCAKVAGAGFSEGPRAELGGTGAKVTTIALGVMRAESFGNAWLKGDPQQEGGCFSFCTIPPGISMNAGRDVRQLLAVTGRGQAKTMFSLPAKLLAFGRGLSPDATAEVLSWINRWMLDGGPDVRRIPGCVAEVVRTRVMQGLTFRGRCPRTTLHQIL